MDAKWNFTINLAEQMWFNPKRTVDPHRYVPKIWKKQGGKCAITGIPLWIVNSQSQLEDHWMDTCAVDFLERQYGYNKGNVRLVCADIAEQRATFDYQTYPFRDIRFNDKKFLTQHESGALPPVEFVIWKGLIQAMRKSKACRRIPLLTRLKANQKTMLFGGSLCLEILYHSQMMSAVYVTDRQIIVERFIKSHGDPNCMYISLLANQDFVQATMNAVAESTRLGLEVVFTNKGVGYYIKPSRRYLEDVKLV